MIDWIGVVDNGGIGNPLASFIFVLSNGCCKWCHDGAKQPRMFKISLALKRNNYKNHAFMECEFIQGNTHKKKKKKYKNM